MPQRPEGYVYTNSSYADRSAARHGEIGTSALAQCEHCESVQPYGEMSEWGCQDCRYCASCGEEPCQCGSGYLTERPYSDENLPQFQSRKKGKYIKSMRLFSAEIECYYPNGKALNALRHIPQAVGISSDGSLDNRGIELQTPKLKGAQGEKMLRAICQTLREADYSVDRTTGLHVHLDGKGLLPRTRTTTEPVELKQLWYFYHMFDAVMLSFLPHSRRMNHYCHSVKSSAQAERIAEAKTVAELERIWYKDSRPSEIAYRKAHKYDNSRYCGLNLHSLFSAKHVEIRFHGGTLNAIKMLEWIQLHQTILDCAARHQLPIAASKLAQDMSLEAMTIWFFQILDLPERTQKYFLNRQKTFAKSPENEGESDTAITEPVEMAA